MYQPLLAPRWEWKPIREGSVLALLSGLVISQGFDYRNQVRTWIAYSWYLKAFKKEQTVKEIDACRCQDGLSVCGVCFLICRAD